MIGSATSIGTRRPHAGGGFTMIELIAVIVILAVISVGAAASLSSLQDSRAAMAGKSLLRDLTFARQHAIATGRKTWVEFDTTAKDWRILAEVPSVSGRTAVFDTATGSDYVQAIDTGSFAGIDFVSVDFTSTDEVGFDWLGRPFDATDTALAAAGTVTLTGNHVVRVHQETGYAVYEAP